MPSVFILGPSLANVIEPTPSPSPGSGRRGVAFADIPTEPGGLVHLKLQPAQDGDATPLNVYAFYTNPASAVPSADQLTADWFFKSKVSISGSTPTAHAPDAFDVKVAGITPGAYHVQTVLEYAA